MAFTQSPTNATAGVAIAPAVKVAVEDAGNNIIAGDTSLVTLNPRLALLVKGTTVAINAVNGIATFSNLIINASGSYTLTATDGTLTSTTSGSFSIAAASATKLAIIQPPNGATAGAAISPAVTVAVEDTFGNVVTTNTSAVTLTLSAGVFSTGATPPRQLPSTASRLSATWSSTPVEITPWPLRTARDRGNIRQF